MRAVQQAIRDGAGVASVRSVRAHFGWRTARVARALGLRRLRMARYGA
jgi:hypothetical protein